MYTSHPCLFLEMDDDVHVPNLFCYVFVVPFSSLVDLLGLPLFLGQLLPLLYSCGTFLMYFLCKRVAEVFFSVPRTNTNELCINVALINVAFWGTSRCT